MVLHLNEDAVVRDRIYVSSRTSKPKNGVLANEEGSIYGHSPLHIANPIRTAELVTVNFYRHGTKYQACVLKMIADVIAQTEPEHRVGALKRRTGAIPYQHAGSEIRAPG